MVVVSIRRPATYSTAGVIPRLSPNLQRPPCFPMPDFEYEPISRPNSAINEISWFCQVSLVNKGLEKNPHPREDFYRQFSVTPERQTPESQRTPCWPWSDPEEYKEAADSAEEAADSLKRFYAGRVLLREAPDGSAVCGYYTGHWRLKAKEWLDEVRKLEEEHETRTKQEERGEAEQGYAQALLLSPFQSPPPSDHNLQTTASKSTEKSPVVRRLPKQSITKSQSQPRKKRPHPQQPTPAHSSDSNTEVTKSRKRSRVEFGEWEEAESSLNKTSPSKRQRMEVNKPTPKHKSDLVSKTGPQKKSCANKISKRSQGLRKLPWELRSRNVTSYREVGTRAASKKKLFPSKRRT